MDYSRIYAEFIQDRRRKEVDTVLSNDYTEKHHILPRAKGGGDSADNLIYLTPEDHFFAHLLLAKVYGGKMWLAVVLMTASHSRCYGESRRLHGFAARAAQKDKAPDAEAIAKMLATQQRKAPRFDFLHLQTGERFSGTAVDFAGRTGMRPGEISKVTTERVRTAHGWALAKNAGLPVGKRDLTVRIFKHKDGPEFEGTAYDFRHRFGLDAGLVSVVISRAASRNSVKGWRYVGEKAA